MKDPKGRKIVGFDKHVFVCENKRDSGHPRECCYNKSNCLLYTSPSPRDRQKSRMPSSA